MVPGTKAFKITGLVDYVLVLTFRSVFTNWLAPVQEPPRTLGNFWTLESMATAVTTYSEYVLSGYGVF